MCSDEEFRIEEQGDPQHLPRSVLLTNTIPEVDDEEGGQICGNESNRKNKSYVTPITSNDFVVQEEKSSVFPSNSDDPVEYFK